LEGSNLEESGDDTRIPITAAGRVVPLSARRDPLPYNQLPLDCPN
jgi:hypothetical protein